MFDEFLGLPLHPLVIHAAVVFLPLTVLTALAFAVVPAWRWLLRWPLVGGAAISLATTFVSTQSGDALFTGLGRPEFVTEHREAGTLLLWFVVAFFVVAVAAAFLLGGRTRVAGGKDRPGAAASIQVVVAVLLVVAAVGTGYQTVVTGDAGARATWGTG